MTLAWTWFFIASLFVAIIIPFFWKEPSNGARFARVLAWGALRALGLRMRVENTDRLYSNQPCVYVANHQSNLDIMTMGYLYPFRTVVIGKKEILWVPLFGLVFVGTGNIVIDRSDRAHSRAGMDSAADMIRKKNVSVWVFAEGTRNRGASELLPFKNGAFHMAIAAQVPIVPIVARHLRNYLDFERRWIRPGEVLIKVLEPVPTKGMTPDDMPKLIAGVRARMQAVLAQPDMGPPCE